MHSHNDLFSAAQFITLYKKLQREEFVIDRTGVKMVELICPVIELEASLDPLDLGPRKTPMDYVMQELNWYLSQDLNVKEISKVASMWSKISSKDGEINSNYGWMIFSSDNGNQFDNCINELINNKDSRRAVMIYQRPSMWEDWNRDGMNDFVCTDGVQLFIRNDKLIYIVKQRSCDAIYGYFNDLAWHQFVYEKSYIELLKTYPNLQRYKLMYVPFSFHIYERHFDLLKSIATYFIEKYNQEFYQ